MNVVLFTTLLDQLETRYTEMQSLLVGATVVFTDFEGLPNETTVLAESFVRLRERTERPVTITHGTNRIAP